MKYHVIIEPVENGIFIADVPLIPGYVPQSGTRAKALINIREAIETYPESLAAHEEPALPSISEDIIEVTV
ncbi:type II toxin-antitoxin system HicB family antitoxin [Candidatus Competibacter phosphatis]|uniref:Type II toxin-antitoxin system HicB family antitoxin n=1 Tax=Candidatus Competibacter phosphatis TaxID=221280 RepID=A0ABX1TLX9_9GAMM|nr:type II toxin-antitoxin system HicB family antitoxin [Candidatus Competibacter phosphatis]NMQ20411.1 type II toxin-antitoxin system HicB family antitoxin [Candidatus Competibacter phosphatis]